MSQNQVKYSTGEEPEQRVENETQSLLGSVIEGLRTAAAGMLGTSVNFLLSLFGSKVGALKTEENKKGKRNEVEALSQVQSKFRSQNSSLKYEILHHPVVETFILLKHSGFSYIFNLILFIKLALAISITCLTFTIKSFEISQFIETIQKTF